MNIFTPNDELLSKTLWFSVFFWTHWYGSLFFQSFYLHRCLTHAQYSMSVFWQNTCQTLSWVFSGSSYLDPIGYAIMHTAHHDYTETDKDPHSPVNYENPFVYMYDTYIEYRAAIDGKNAELIKGKGLRQIEWFNTFASKRITRAAWVLLYLYLYWMLFPLCWISLPLAIPLFLITVFMGPFHGFLVNWCCHKYGYTNFKTGDASKNLFFVIAGILLLGEGYHNNHHGRKWSWNFGFRWFEPDPLAPIIWFLHIVRIVRIPKTV